MTWTYPCKPTVESGGPIFRPEAYGAAGDGATDDTAAVQAALDAANAAGERCTVRLDQSYVIGLGDDLHDIIGDYDVSYGLWLNASDVILDGNATGSLVVLGVPAAAYGYLLLLVGNGGHSVADGESVTTWEDMEANGTWTEGCVVKDLAVDASALSDANLAAMSGAMFSGILNLAFCRDCTVHGVTVDRAWGYGIGSSCSSSDCTFDSCTIEKAYQYAFFFDGPEGCTFDTLIVNDFVLTNATTAGISFGTNTDYRHNAGRNTIQDCQITNAANGLAVIAWADLWESETDDTEISGCVITLPADISITRVGITVTVSTLLQNWPTRGIRITDCTINKAGGGIKGWGLYLRGYDEGFGGEPVGVEGVLATGNTFGSLLAYALVLHQQAKNNTFANNTVGGVNTVVDISGGTATGNMVDGVEV